jgi:hypothetical protein
MIGPGTYEWSMDGNYNVSWDGYPGWSMDGYEPVKLSVALSLLANAGSYITSITYVPNPDVPPGYVITGIVPYLTTPGPVALQVSALPPRQENQVYVPDTVGMFYVDAQLAILNAGMLILPPILVISEQVLPQYVVQQPGIPTPVL